MNLPSCSNTRAYADTSSSRRFYDQVASAPPHKWRWRRRRRWWWRWWLRHFTISSTSNLLQTQLNKEKRFHYHRATTSVSSVAFVEVWTLWKYFPFYCCFLYPLMLLRLDAQKIAYEKLLLIWVLLRAPARAHERGLRHQRTEESGVIAAMFTSLLRTRRLVGGCMVPCFYKYLTEPPPPSCHTRVFLLLLR